MQEIKKSKLKINKSKFYGHLYNINNLDEIKNIIKKHKKKYKKANHHCLAAISGKEYIFKNDGEVGHPGKIILQIMQENKLNNHCIIISRIFGGIKLGPGGVSRSFKECAKLLLKK
jgi:putative IMPACT (imprinted ancient) family translation regulator